MHNTQQLQQALQQDPHLPDFASRQVGVCGQHGSHRQTRPALGGDH